ncbi:MULTISPECIES: site-specific integrase [Butyricimonas]|uniref:site-specific integrase n=1 Tax=Butyricimonas TaxID=574697 RepID=UPI0007FB2430|nr:MULTISPECIES: site-specific integrase [Butyricimonas]
MSTSVSVVYYTSKTLKNGNHPLMLRVTQNRKTKYVSLGISIHPDYWNFKKNEPKTNCPNKVAIQRLITDKIKDYTGTIIDLEVEKKDFTPTSLIEKVDKPTKRLTAGELFLQQIAQLKKEERFPYAASYKQTYNSLIEYNKHLDIYFSDIDEQWLKKYESWLRTKEIAANTIGIRFRNIRTLYNVAIDEGHVKSECYPFKKYKVSKLHENTPKRAIVKDKVVKVIKHKATQPDLYSELSIDLFTFSYIMGGINFTDMARIKHDNIIDGRLAYKRKKTKKLILLPLQSKAIEIINKYRSDDNPYIFPILSTFHKTEQQKLNRIHKVIGKVNKHLKAYGAELKLDKKLTTYVARHSFSTTLKKAGVSTSVISEALGHSSEKVTQTYLDCFENEQMDAAMTNLL